MNAMNNVRLHMICLYRRLVTNNIVPQVLHVIYFITLYTAQYGQLLLTYKVLLMIRCMVEVSIIDCITHNVNRHIMSEWNTRTQIHYLSTFDNLNTSYTHKSKFDCNIKSFKSFKTQHETYRFPWVWDRGGLCGCQYRHWQVCILTFVARLPEL